MPYLESHISLLWLPAGIALAAFIRWGWVVWPGVYLGAFLAHFSVGSTAILAAGIAAGNTLGPLLAAKLLTRDGLQPTLSDLKSVGLFVSSVFGGMTISSLNGVANLLAAGSIAARSTCSAWLGWWMGDTLGALLVTPLILAVTANNVQRLSGYRSELLLWALTAGLVCRLVFVHDHTWIGHGQPLVYLTLPLFIWAAMRFGQLGSALAGMIFSIIAIWSTARGMGVFFLPDSAISQFLLWGYIATIALTGLFITAMQAERRQAETTLRENEAKLRGLYELSPLGIVLTDAAGHFIDFNMAFRNICGHSAEQLRNLDYWALTPERYEAEEARQLELLASRGRYGPYEKEYIRQDGSRVPIRLNGMLIRGQNGQEYIWSLIEDISDRKTAEVALHRSNRLYTLLSLATQAIVRAQDMDLLLAQICHIAVEQGGFVMAWASHVVQGQLFPYSHWGKEDGYVRKAHEIAVDPASGGGPTGAAIREGRHFVCQDIATDPFMAPWRKIALERGYRSNAAFPVLFDGEVISSFSFYAPEPHFFTPDVVSLLEGLTEDVAFAMNAHAEIVRRRKAESELSKLNEQLERRVRERTQQLEAANEELEAFSYSVSHDLRAPLRSIDSFSQILMKRYSEKLDDTGRDYLARVCRASDRMEHLINDLLYLSRVTRNPLRLQRVNLTALAKSILEDLQRADPSRKVDCRVTEGMRTIGDLGLLRIALTNLLSNAWKFTRDTRLAAIEFSCRADRNRLIYFVRDNGAGFDPAYSQKLFQVFQRLHSEIEFEGTGIGLATVRKVIKRHHGNVWVDGAPDKGATFYFTLPQQTDIDERLRLPPATDRKLDNQIEMDAKEQ